MDLNSLRIDLETPQVKVKRRSSFFNIENSHERDTSTKKAEYIDKLNKEKMDWVEVIQRTNGRVRELALKEKAVYDSSILSNERRDYLNQVPDFASYLQQCEEYSHQVLLYVKQKEWTQKRLQYCQEQLNDALTDSTIKTLSTSRDSLPKIVRPH